MAEHVCVPECVEPDGHIASEPAIPKFDLEVKTPTFMAPGSVVSIFVKPAGEEAVAQVDIAIEMFAILFPGLVQPVEAPAGIITP